MRFLQPPARSTTTDCIRPEGTPAPLRRALVFHPGLLHTLYSGGAIMAKHDSIPVSSSKLPLFAPFAVPKIGNMATAWHEILHLGTKQRHSA